MKKRVLYSLSLLFFFAQLHSQDAEFNNVNHSLVFLNPSFSGSNGYLRNQTDYRNQWPSLPGTFVFFNTCFDGYIKPLHGGISFSAFSNNIARGLIKQNKFSLAYAQYFSLRDSSLKIIPSVQLTYGLNTLDKNELSFGGPSYPSYGLPTTWTSLPAGQVHYWDLSAGIVFKAWTSYFGAALFNILEPNISFAGVYKTPMRGVIHASHNEWINRHAKINVFLSYTMQGTNSWLNLRVLNSNYNNPFMWGMGYKAYLGNDPKVVDIFKGRNNVSFYLGLRQKAFTVNYSFDFQPSKLSGNTAGSHELSISISLKRKDDAQRLSWQEKMERNCLERK